jgi:hypothetical protein
LYIIALISSLNTTTFSLLFPVPTVYAGENGKVDVMGTKEEVFGYLKKQYETIADSTSGKAMSAKSIEPREVGRHLPESGNFEASNASGPTKVLSRDGYEKVDTPKIPVGEPFRYDLHRTLSCCLYKACSS